MSNSVCNSVTRDVQNDARRNVQNQIQNQIQKSFLALVSEPTNQVQIVTAVEGHVAPLGFGATR